MKGAIYFIAIAKVIFSHVKISSYRAKVHLVFHWCLYNRTIYARTNGLPRAEFKGLENFECHDEGEFNFQELVKKLRAKDSQ